MSSSVLSGVQYFILFSFIFVQLKNIFWSESTGLFFQGSESGPPRLYCLMHIFKGHTCQLQRTFCLWLVGIQSRLDVTSGEGNLVENGRMLALVHRFSIHGAGLKILSFAEGYWVFLEVGWYTD